MDMSAFFWGLIAICAGVFISVYGLMLFKFALAAMGFTLGFIASWWLLDSQETVMRFLISLVAGAVIGILLFALVRFGVYIAGGILGLVIAILIGGVLEIAFSSPNDWLMSVLALGGIVGGGIIGPRMGRMIILVATSAAGALLIVEGLQKWFSPELAATGNPARALGSGIALTVFVVLVALSALGQNNARQLRHRVLN